MHCCRPPVVYGCCLHRLLCCNSCCCTGWCGHVAFAATSWLHTTAYAPSSQPVNTGEAHPELLAVVLQPDRCRESRPGTRALFSSPSLSPGPTPLPLRPLEGLRSRSSA